MRGLAELLATEFLREPEACLQIAGSLQYSSWTSHEVFLDCQKSGDICIPYGLFADGAAWRGKGTGTRGSLMNYFASIVGMPRRRTITCMRKEIMCGEGCGCSCRGRCSMDVIEAAIAEQATAAAQGVLPDANNK